MGDTFLVVLPLMLSPGPANLVSLALAARYGFVDVFSFQLGIFSVYAVVAVVLGLVTSQIVEYSTFATTILQLVGGLFVIYLGYCLARRKQADAAELDVPGFSKGVLLQILNPKYPAVVLTVFVNRPGEPALVTAGIITAIGAAGLLIYSLIGSSIRRLSFSGNGLRLVDVGFGLLLCLVGAWIAIKPFVTE